jgi:pilus assembly protein CpaE
MSEEGKPSISILLVDDIAEARENVKKLLAFEQDFKVIGSASNGREAVQQAKELKPDIIIMDINMPDMDGLEAASLINKGVPTAGVIMMSVQNDQDYMRRAMMAGARYFLTKPPDMDELYSTIRSVYQQYEPIRLQMEYMGDRVIEPTGASGDGDRAGHIIVVYSPQGGVGCTTIATNIASALMKEGIKVLLVDSDLQFADVSFFLNLTGSQSTIIDLADSVDDLDTELFENIVTTHDSGLKVLLGPTRPEHADALRENPAAVASILDSIANNYDFIVVDTSTAIDPTLVPILDLASKIVLVGSPTLVSVKNVRLVLDLFDQWEYPKDKTLFVLNHVATDRARKQATLTTERIESYLKRHVTEQIPQVEERLLLSAINKGVPIIAAERDQNKPPVKQLLHLSDEIFHALMGVREAEGEEQSDPKKRRLPFG